jgi:four helix bundle protein
LAEDIRHRSYKFSVEVVKYVYSISVHKNFSSILNQLVRSSTSIAANIIEAKSSSSRKEFARYYQIALKSANETKYWLCLFRDALDLDKNKIEGFLKEVTEIANIIAASVKTLKSSKT